MSESTIYDAAGGAAAFRRLAAADHERCVADPVTGGPPNTSAQ
jgi:hypothetical protein